jgi:hypothetical protein
MKGKESVRGWKHETVIIWTYEGAIPIGWALRGVRSSLACCWVHVKILTPEVTVWTEVKEGSGCGALTYKG